MALKISAPAIIGSTLLLAVLVLAALRFAVSTSPPEASSSLENNELEPVSILSPSPTMEPSPVPSSVPDPNRTTVSQSSPGVSSSSGAKPVELSGSLRVSNRSLHPLRLVLLKRQKSEPNHKKPVHWDFAPEEGSLKGLLVSLPEDDLKLQPGDILVAFAQDGSRLYWGPYVVGETALPVWNLPETEWQLLLEN